jgi:aminomethyltransferase
LTNDLRKLAVGQGQYTLLCLEHGGVVDDLYVFRTADQAYLLVLNASRLEADLAWLQKQLATYPQGGQVQLDNVSAATGAVAVQGPQVVDFINACLAGPSLGGTIVAQATDLKKNQIARFPFQDQSCWVSRTGYTGEDGFEIMTPAGLIEAVWERLLEAGQAAGLQPAGLGARDTLRTEVCYPLYGHELDAQTTPIEAGLGFFVSLNKGEFIGRSVLAEQKARGTAKQCVAFKMLEKSAPPRPSYAIWSAGPAAKKIGQVTSGTQSPSLGLGIGLGYVPPASAQPGTTIHLEIRGKPWPAEIVAKPVYRKAAA